MPERIAWYLAALFALTVLAFGKWLLFDKEDVEFYDDSFLDPSEKKAEGSGEEVDKAWWDED